MCKYIHCCVTTGENWKCEDFHTHRVSQPLWHWQSVSQGSEPFISLCWSITISSYLSRSSLISLFCFFPFLILWFLSQGVNLLWRGSGAKGLPNNVRVQGGAIYMDVQDLKCVLKSLHSDDCLVKCTQATFSAGCMTLDFCENPICQYSQTHFGWLPMLIQIYTHIFFPPPNCKEHCVPHVVELTYYYANSYLCWAVLLLKVNLLR